MTGHNRTYHASGRNLAVRYSEHGDQLFFIKACAMCDYADRVGDKHFDPSIVQFGEGRQYHLAAHVELLSDGSAVYDMRINEVMSK